MAAKNPTNSNGSHFDPANGAFPHHEGRKRRNAGWEPVDIGGDEALARLHLEMRPGRQAAGEGRHALDGLVGSVADNQLDTLRLLVTELVSNSVRHGGADDWIQLDVDVYASAVRVEVHDGGPGFQPLNTPRPHADRPGGWGLCLVDRLADRWGVALDDRTRVWFEIDQGSRGGLEAAAA
jgi:anti-sigma regulatory factor (Ser/Thr protein kinase)